MSEAEINLLMATTVKDAILERISNYTPVTNGHKALIMAYTHKQFVALKDFVEEHKIPLPLGSLERQVATAMMGTEFAIPEL